MRKSTRKARSNPAEKSSQGSGDDEIDRETCAAQRDYAVVRAAKAKEEVVWLDLVVKEIESIFGNIRTRIRQLQYDLPDRLVGRTEKEMADTSKLLSAGAIERWNRENNPQK